MGIRIMSANDAETKDAEGQEIEHAKSWLTEVKAVAAEPAEKETQDVGLDEVALAGAMPHCGRTGRRWAYAGVVAWACSRSREPQRSPPGPRRGGDGGRRRRRGRYRPRHCPAGQGSGRSLIGLGHQGEVSMPQCNGMHASAALHAHVLANCAMNSHTISLDGGPSPVPERYGLWPTA